MKRETYKEDEPALVHMSGASERMGAFDHALKSGLMSDILPKHGDSFTFTGPYGIISVKPAPEAIEKLIALMKTHGVFEKGEESILDCWVSRKELESGGKVKWESGRYKSGVKDEVTLVDWLEESKVIPINVVRQNRKDVEGTLEQVEHSA